MATTTEDLRNLLNGLDEMAAGNAAAEARLKMFEGVLVEISTSLSDIVAIMERPEEPEPPEMEHTPPDFSPIVGALMGIKAAMEKPEPPEKPDDYSQIVDAIKSAAPSRPAGWEFEFDYSFSGAISKMRAKPLVS